MMIKKDTNHFSSKLYDVLLCYENRKQSFSLQSFKPSMVFLLSDKIKLEHYEPAFLKGIEEQNQNIEDHHRKPGNSDIRKYDCGFG